MTAPRVNPLTGARLPDPVGNGETYWNGERVNAARGWATVHGERIRIVRVFYGGEHLDLDDSDESGWRKVAFGYGSPRYRHRNVVAETGTFQPDSWQPVIEEWAKREGLDPDARDEVGR